MNKWIKRYMLLAESISTWSKDPNKKVGAIIVNNDNTLVSSGYNGFPIKVQDNIKRLEEVEEKLLYTVHAELNAILFAKTNLQGCSIYTTFFPCSHCMGAIIQSGIRRVVTFKLENNKDSKWFKSFEASRLMAHEASIEIYEINKEDIL